MAPRCPSPNPAQTPSLNSAWATPARASSASPRRTIRVLGGLLASLRVVLATVLLGAPLLAGGPTMHLAQAHDALKKIQDPELRALLRVDEILELSTHWESAKHHETLRLVPAGDQLFLLGRASDGIQTWVWDGASTWTKVTFAAPALSDWPGGWIVPEYYETLRVEAAGDDLYLVARSATGVLTYRLDAGSLTWTNLPTIAGLSDAAGYSLPEYYSTIRTEVIGDDLYLLVRGAAGVYSFRLDADTETWQGLEFLGAMSDGAGWNVPQYYSTLRTGVIGSDLYLLGRSSTGILLYRFDTLTGSWFGMQSSGAMSDGAGWNSPQYYSTLRTAVIDDDLYVLGRASGGLVLYRFDTSAGAWASLPSFGYFTDASNWDDPDSYETLRAEVIGDRLYVLGRGDNGTVPVVYDVSDGAWQSLQGNGGVMTNANGWTDPTYYRSIRTAVLGDDLVLLGRNTVGVETHWLDTTDDSWHAGAASQPPWADGGFYTLGGYVVNNELKSIYSAYQNGAMFPDAFNNYPWPSAGPDLYQQDGHHAEFLWAYAKFARDHLDNPLVVAHFLGCIAHVAGDARLDRFFLGQTEELCGIEHQYGLIPLSPGETAQEYVDIWLDNQYADVLRAQFGHPLAITGVVPDVYAPSYLADLLYEAFPPDYYSPTLFTTDVIYAMNNGWQYTRTQGSLNPFGNLYYGPDCQWALTHFESGLGGVRDGGTAIAAFLDDTWAFLEQGQLPRFEKGNQGNQMTLFAHAYKLLGDPALTDIAVGADVGAGEYTPTPAAPDFAIALQEDHVSWHQVRSGVVRYAMHDDLLAALVATPGGVTLQATEGYLDTPWTDWTPPDLAGVHLAELAIERLDRSSDTLRVALLTEAGALHAVDRSLGVTGAASPVSTWIADGVTAFQLEGDRIGWLVGGQLYTQDGLGGRPLLQLDDVERFQLEGARTGAVVAGVLKLRQGPTGPWTDELADVARFELADSLVAALLDDGSLKARWGWRTVGAGPALSNDGGWDGPQYYDTIRTAMVGDDLYLLARGHEAVSLFRQDGVDHGWTGLEALDAMTDAAGWDEYPYYSTLRTAVVGSDLYMVGRAPGGIETHRFDTVMESWESFAPSTIMSAGWSGPAYYKTIRTAVVGGELYLLGRSDTGLVLYRFDDTLGAWQPQPGFGYFTDASNWDDPDSYETLRVEVVGDALYVLGRGDNGTVVVRYDTGGGWAALPGQVGVMTNASGWTSPTYYESIRTEVVGDDIYLLGRNDVGVETHRFDTLTNEWDTLPPYGALGDADGWDALPYRSTLRTAAAGDTLYLVARADSGVALHALDTATDTWQPVSLGFPYWVSPYHGWELPKYHETIRLEAAGDTLHVVGRHAAGIESYAFETGAPAWRTLARRVSDFGLEGNLLAMLVDEPHGVTGAAQAVGGPGPSTAQVLQRELEVVQLGSLPATLDEGAQWWWSPTVTISEPVADFRLGGDTPNLTAGGRWWLTTRLADGTLLDHGRQTWFPNAWRQHLPVAKELATFSDSRIEVSVPVNPTDTAVRADRQALLIQGDLYVKDVW